MKFFVPDIGALIGVHVRVCGLKFVDLTSNTVTILWVLFPHNKDTTKIFFKVILDIQNILRLWRMRRLIKKEKITIFKTTLH